MPANRVAALGGTLTAIVAALVTLLGALDGDTAKAIVIVTVLIVVAVIVVTFLIGSQRSEKLAHDTPSAPDFDEAVSSISGAIVERLFPDVEAKAEPEREDSELEADAPADVGAEDPAPAVVTTHSDLEG
jgi:hypothetical protein